MEKRVGPPLAVQQAVEYLLGLGIILMSLHGGNDNGRWLIVATGAACALLAAVTKGSLGAVHWLGPRAHRAATIVVAVAVVAVTVVTGHATQLDVSLPVLAAALVLLKLASMGLPPARRPKGSGLGLGIGAEDVGRMAGRASGQLVRRWRERDRDR